MITKRTWQLGVKSGWNTTLILGKVIFPVTFVVTILKYTPVIDWIINIFTPFMKWLGLPGEAAIPLALGMILNLYAAIAAIITLDLTVKSVFILAVMLSFAHNLIVETAVTKKIGIKATVVVGIRIGLAVISAFLINILWTGGDAKAEYGLVAADVEHAELWYEIVLLAFKTAALGILQIALIIFPLMVGIQILKDLKIIDYLSRRLEPATKKLGLSSGKASVPLLAGLIFGLAYGAGIIIDSAKEEELSQKDLYLLSIFLIACHAVVEDTLLFVPLGINVLPLLLIRLFVAIVITIITARVWKRVVPVYNQAAAFGIGSDDVAVCDRGTSMKGEQK